MFRNSFTMYNMRRLFFPLFFVLALASVSLAADTICGVDTDVNGTYSLACAAPDADRDGYATDGSGRNTGTDCDDTDRFVYPGVETTNGCTGGQHHTCQSNGTYTACTSAAYCPASCAACYYINASTGSDANAGSYVSPWETYLNFVSRYAEEDRPAGWVDAVDGSNHGRCFFFSSGTYDDVYSYNGDASGLFLRGKHAVAGYPVIIAAYPGQEPVFRAGTSPNPIKAVYLLQSDYVTIDGLTITGNYGDGINLETVDYAEISRNKIYDNDGKANYNQAGLSLGSSTDYASVHHNVLWGNYERGNYTENNTQMVIFRGTGDAVKNNVFLMPDVSGSRVGTVFKQKHADYGTTLNVEQNVFMAGGPQVLNQGVAFAGPAITFSYNETKNADLFFGDEGGTNYQQSEIITYNTFVDSSLFYSPTKSYNAAGDAAADECSGDYAIGTLTVGNNVFVDSTSSYDADRRIFVASSYGHDAIYTDVVTGGKLSLASNCYYNSVTDVSFGLYERNDSNADCSHQGFLGQSYTWAQWQAAGYDAGSYNENPSLDSSNRATSTNCRTFGWQAGAAAAAVNNFIHAMTGGFRKLLGGFRQ